MKRRDFIKALAGGVTAGAAMPFLPMPSPPTRLVDPQTGISMRFVQQFNGFDSLTQTWTVDSLDFATYRVVSHA